MQAPFRLARVSAGVATQRLIEGQSMAGKRQQSGRIASLIRALLDTARSQSRPAPQTFELKLDPSRPALFSVVRTMLAYRLKTAL